MAKNKQKYWKVDKLLETEAQYCMAIGERSNGKSYACKTHVLQKAYKEGAEFIILRRHENEAKKTNIELYFSDMPIETITNGEWELVVVKSTQLFFARLDETTDRLVVSKRIGYCMALTKSQSYKSGAYPLVQTIIFEEFISEGGFYLGNECEYLMSIVSTVFRRNTGKVFLIGNKISRVCVYFSEWGLTGIDKQKPGTIDVYEFTTDQYTEEGENVILKIAVENCENSGNNSSMFWGNTLDSVGGGKWQTRSYPRLPGKEEDYTNPYTFFFQFANFTFRCDYLVKGQNECIYVKPFTKNLEESARIISKVTFPFPLYTNTFFPLFPEERHIFNILDYGQVYYSTNLTGSDFTNCVKSHLK